MSTISLYLVRTMYAFPFHRWGHKGMEYSFIIKSFNPRHFTFMVKALSTAEITGISLISKLSCCYPAATIEL